MSTRRLAAVLVLVLAATAAPARAQKVYVDYSPLADFSSYQTFAWGPTPQASLLDNNPLNHSRVKNAVRYYLTKSGLTELEPDQGPQLFVTYHGEVDSAVSVNSFADQYAAYGYPAGWAWDPGWINAAGMTSTTPIVHEAGTLVIDVWDAEKKSIIWRGTITGTLSDDLQKGAKKLERGIEKLVGKWQEIRAKELAK
jgi:hypothetical protein